MRRVLHFVPAILLGIIILTGCGDEILYPGISYPPTYSYSPGQFVWRDLVTSNPGSSEKFYESVFGWTFEQAGTGGSDYYLVRCNKEIIGGMLKYKGDTTAGYGATWINSLSVQDIHGALNRCVRNGGSVVKKPFQVKGRGTLAVLKDNQGALLVLIHSRDGDPFEREAAVNTWLWSELWSNDPVSSSLFYYGLTGYSTEKTGVDGKDYWIFRNEGKMVSSMLKNPLDSASAAWVPYIRVSDPDETLEKAKAAGAILLFEPSPLIRKGSVAVLKDPGGAIFGIQKWPVE